jgi:hypothetical protein
MDPSVTSEKDISSKQFSEESSSENSLEDSYRILDFYRNKPLLFDLSPYQSIQQQHFYKLLTYYTDQIKSKCKPILINLSVDELVEEQRSLSCKMSNDDRLTTDGPNPNSHSDTNFELAENVYIEAINEILYSKLYPDNLSIQTLFKEFAKVIEDSKDKDKDLMFVSKDETKLELVINSINCSKWRAKITKDRGEYIWNCKWINNSWCFSCSHYDLMRSKGEHFKRMVWDCLPH